MRTLSLLTLVAQVACSQAKDADTAAEMDSAIEQAEPSTEPSSEPSSEETDTDMGVVVVNEICADASATEDWVEFYNSTDTAVDASTWMIGDDQAEMVTVGDLVTDATIPAGGFLLVMTKVALADGTEIGFGLKKDGSESLFVQMGDDTWSTEVPEAVAEDTSYARIPDGGDVWENGVVATPAMSNQ